MVRNIIINIINLARCTFSFADSSYLHYYYTLNMCRDLRRSVRKIVLLKKYFHSSEVIHSIPQVIIKPNLKRVNLWLIGFLAVHMFDFIIQSKYVYMDIHDAMHWMIRANRRIFIASDTFSVQHATRIILAELLLSTTQIKK